MTWREDLIDADFDGVPFEYREVSEENGPRNIVHEIATSGFPVVERLGDGPRRFTIEAFVLGDEYLAAKDELRERLIAPGPHVIAHPYEGDLRVELTGPFTISESPRLGGSARFRIPLVLVSEQQFPEIRSTADDLAQSVTLTLDVSAEGFRRRFNLGAFIASITNTIGLAGTAMTLVQGKIRAAMNITDNLLDTIDETFSQALDLLDTPLDLAQSVLNTVLNTKARLPLEGLGLRDRVNKIVQTAEEIGRDLRGFEPAAPDVPAVTPEALLEQQNAAEVARLMRIGNVLGSAQNMTTIPFENTAQIDLLADGIGLEFDEILFDPDTEDETHDAVTDLRAKTFAHLAAIRQTLPRLTERKTPANLPALVIAYQIYGDATRDLEIVERNEIRDPNQVRQSLTLEVAASA